MESKIKEIVDKYIVKAQHRSVLPMTEVHVMGDKESDQYMEFNTKNDLSNFVVHGELLELKRRNIKHSDRN